jgi:predicted transcriptional regulator
MRASDVMTKSVRTVSPGIPAADAWELMRQRNIRHLVVTEGSEVLGILSERDAGGRRGSSVRARSTVADLMTAPVVSVTPETTVRRIANLMRGRTIGCVPVVNRGRLAGIVTVSDLLQLLGRGIDRPAQPQRQGLHFRSPHRKKKGAHGVW